MWTKSVTDNEIKVRDVVIDTDKGGEPVELIQITDLHLSWVSEEDRKDPVIASSYEFRRWGKDGAFWPRAEKCLDFAKDADAIVITGDIYDYLTDETVKKTRELLFDKYDNLIACIGNHEPAKKMQGEVEETMPLEDRIKYLETRWCNDIYYCSRVFGEKVMVIALDNSSASRFWDRQIEPLRSDLAKAREKGYAVLLFYHDPMSTGDERYIKVDTLDRGDATCRNFYNSNVQISASSEGASGEIYRMIISNGDIIKGAFCGHYHSDFYTEIAARTADGAPTVIPQYVLKGVVYDKGNVLRITVR